MVRHSGQNWYWGILKRRLLGVQLARPQTSGQREEKSVALLDYGNTFYPLDNFNGLQCGYKKL